MFHFWLNSESIRHRDLPSIYENKDFTIPESATDEELIQIILPRDIFIYLPKMNEQSRFSLAPRSSNAEGVLSLTKGNIELVE